MIGRQPDGSLVNVEPRTNYVRIGNQPLPNVPSTTTVASTFNGESPLVPTTAYRPLWDTTPLPTPPATLADYQEACRKIRELAKTHVGPWSSWKIILDLLPKE